MDNNQRWWKKPVSTGWQSNKALTAKQYLIVGIVTGIIIGNALFSILT